MPYHRPIVLSIAGFDPCGGAGVLADMKAIEQQRCLGMAINTAYTTQVEDRFISMKWASLEEIGTSITPLMERYRIDFVKIGIVENLHTLYEIVKLLKQKNKEVKIIWDTVLVASSHFKFIDSIDQALLKEILKDLYLITPNTPEAITLSGHLDEMSAAKSLAVHCHVLLKGGHSQTEKGSDHLFYKGQCFKLKAGSTQVLSPKHGSGCILSSAITANLALGNDLENACKKAKHYIETILNSNPNLLAYHVA
jgi:hydroxymethylpyrimidine/phosphomethylpyrimidine kinase